MPRKSELIEAMVALGEQPPKSWTVAEIESRLGELRQEHGIAPPRTGKSRTPLRQMMVDLNQASRKKAHLIDHVKSLGVSINGNETIKVLMAKGIQAIYDKAEPTGQDPVGFGTHASKTYEELFQGEASYCQWIRTMVQEEESVNPRFMRLALWLDHRVKKEDGTRKAPTMTAAASKGYQTAKEKMAPPNMTEESNSSSNASAETQELKMMITMLATSMGEMKEELAALKNEPPRKHRAPATESISSFEMMEHPSLN